MLVSAPILTALLAVAPPQDPKPSDLVIRVKPAQLELVVGQSAQLSTEVVDVGGRPADAPVMFFSRERRALRVDAEGKVTARGPGRFEIVVRIPREGGASTVVPVVIVEPEPEAIEFADLPFSIHVGTTWRAAARVVGVGGGARQDLAVEIKSSDPRIASIDAFGFVTAHAPGRCTLNATGAGLATEHPLEVAPNPVARIELTPSSSEVRTGDVVTFTPRTFRGDGDEVRGVPVHLSVHALPDDDLGNGATGQVQQDGRFVAETPGLYTVVATCGTASARTTIRATERFSTRHRLKLVGHGEVLDVHTSDLWIWEGVDRRDYAVTGTWGANGEAIFWDVTDPSAIERIATVRVDARTVNDVKVSSDGRICVISREGASNRRNGIVILDVANPREPRVLSTFDDELTGGVHNVFVDSRFVYALSAGRRYDVIDIQDPGAPFRVGSFQLFEPGASIHDVWVADGVAYSSNWGNGLRLVDVGNGIAGGSPENPVEFASYAYPSGWNHAAFPFKSQDTGKFYVIGGDEAFPYGLHITGKPTYPRGWLHFVDFSDLKNPAEVARYQVPEAGTHNIWIDGDTLYVAYYNGGVRVVDISGDLMGDLYRQGREIAWYLPTHEAGVIPNAPMVWGPQPHKGHLFVSDWNSGLWALKLVEDQRRRR